jgi:predicted AlkP superfamily phosphohydrolase/phosphomutase
MENTMENKQYFEIISENNKWYLMVFTKFGSYVNRNIAFDNEYMAEEVKNLINMAYNQGITDHKEAIKKVLDI